MYFKHVMNSANRPPNWKSRQTGFTLIELLVVMAIIVVISSFVLVAVGGDDGSRAVNNTISRVDATFALARSAAVSRKTPTRVLVDFNPGSLNYLRSVQIFYLDQTDGNWKPFSEPEIFPRNVLMNRDASQNDQMRTWQATINQTTFVVSNASPELSTSVSSGPNQWIAFEFRSNGTAANPMSRFVVTRGTTVQNQANPVGVMPETSAGFALFRSGKVVYFKDHNHIQAN